jgi:hypothetical protein
MKKVAICGWSDTWKEAPFFDKSWEIWSLNHRVRELPRTDLHFDLHDLRTYSETNPYFIWLLNNQDRIMTTGIDFRLKGKVYPKNVIMDMYGDYFTCSMSFMVALAIFEDYETIGLWGIDMVSSVEQQQQLPSLLRFIGLAEGKDINIVLPKECKLYSKKRLYGNWPS